MQILSAQTHVPHVLVLTPPPIGKLPKEDELIFTGAQEKSKLIGQLLQKSSKAYQYDLLDTHSFIEADELNADGLHLPEACHKRLGLAVAEKIMEKSN